MHGLTLSICAIFFWLDNDLWERRNVVMFFFLFNFLKINVFKQSFVAINMLYSLKQNSYLHPLTPHNGHLSKRATFVCPQGGRCG